MSCSRRRATRRHQLPLAPPPPEEPPPKLDDPPEEDEDELDPLQKPLPPGPLPLPPNVHFSLPLEIRRPCRMPKVPAIAAIGDSTNIDPQNSTLSETRNGIPPKNNPSRTARIDFGCQPIPSITAPTATNMPMNG